MDILESVQTEYSTEERELMLTQMTVSQEHFYSLAQQIGNHQFLEFAGVLHAYISCCRQMHARGVDFATHPTEVEDHRFRYIGEKLHCIFGLALQRPENAQAFLASLGLRPKLFRVLSIYAGEHIWHHPTHEEWQGTYTEALEVIRLLDEKAKRIAGAVVCERFAVAVP